MGLSLYFHLTGSTTKFTTTSFNMVGALAKAGLFP